MGTPKDRRPAADDDVGIGIEVDVDADEPPKTPPLNPRARSVLRAVAIVSVFVFAGSMMMWVVCGTGEDPSEWWVEFLVVPGFFLGLAVAAADHLWQRRQR